VPDLNFRVRVRSNFWGFSFLFIKHPPVQPIFLTWLIINQR
jgi:hypothetical protein